jgi:hypothetical protein
MSHVAVLSAFYRERTPIIVCPEHVEAVYPGKSEGKEFVNVSMASGMVHAVKGPLKDVLKEIYPFLPPSYMMAFENIGTKK